jgi:hypothetical protein
VAATALMAGLESYFAKPTIKINSEGQLPQNPSPTIIKVNDKIYGSFSSAMNACEDHYRKYNLVYKYKNNENLEPHNIEPYEHALQLLPSLYQRCHEGMLDLKKTCNDVYGKDKVENYSAPIFCNDPWFYENVYMFGDIKLELDN